MDYATDNLLSKNAFKTIPDEIRYLKGGTKLLGTTINIASVGLDINDLATGEIGVGKFGYRMTGTGVSIYAAAGSGGAGLIVGVFLKQVSCFMMQTLFLLN